MKKRSEYIDLIEEELQIPEKKQRSIKKLSAPATQKLYEKLSGKKAQPIKGRGWHIKKSLEALNLEKRKSYNRNGVSTPQNHLASFWQELQHR